MTKPSRSNVGRATRRSFVKLAAATALVGASGRPNRAWSQPRTPGAARLGNLPSFDGEMLLDDAARQGAASDLGGHVRRMPIAVLRPKSADDIVRAVRFANKHELKIAMRGRGHSQYGQSQVEEGIVIDSATLNSVRLLDSGFLDAQAGALWGEVAKASLAHGLTPPVMLNAMILTLGGTLSVGATGETTYRYDTQADNVLELDVVTGAGELVTCSSERNDELFHMTLAGLGQCGIIVRARLRMVRAPKFVAMRALVYDELDSFLDDQARLTASESLGPMRGQAVREPNGQSHFVLHAGSFIEAADDDRQPSWMAGLRFKREQGSIVSSYWDYLHRGPAGPVGGGAAPARRTGTAWLGVMLPANSTPGITTHVLNNADAFLGVRVFDISIRVGARHTMPLQKMPLAPVGFRLNLQRHAAVAGARDHMAMLAANDALVPRLQAAGGKLFPPNSPILSKPQWREHFGPETWRRFAAAKKRFDPNNVLTPGAGIF